MKSIKKIGMICIATFIAVTSCNENDFLKEKPLSIYSVDNSMVTSSDYQSSVNYLYNRYRYLIREMNQDSRYAFHYGTDYAFNATDYQPAAKLNDYAAVMVPTFSVVGNVWRYTYVIITNANLILNRLNTADIPDSDKARYRGEALFFRALGYRMLAHLYGGVPLVLDEITEPKRDYVRASRKDVYMQIKTDLLEAISLLDNIDNVDDGKVSKQMAQHLLSEIYICLEDYDNAISMASAVIDYPAMGLMTERFGSRKTEEGDVYWDLFRLDNQNRKTSGNTESLWVCQYDYLNTGSANNDMYPWTINPAYHGMTITIGDWTGNVFAGITDWKCGRGIGWMQPTDYFFNGIWEEGDIRNSKYNIIRDLIIDNPDSPAFGKWFVADGYYNEEMKAKYGIRYWYPIITKVARVGNFPEEVRAKDPNGNYIKTAYGEYILTTAASGSFKDDYYFRLAETYLLRAEAYIDKGDKVNAAADINVIRARAKAPLVDASKVDIDYLLDERLRELYNEELRMVVLCRMGKLADRDRKYNPKSGISIQDYHNLWPIPYSEIENNVDAVIEQNPGYEN